MPPVSLFAPFFSVGGSRCFVESCHQGRSSELQGILRQVSSAAQAKSTHSGEMQSQALLICLVKDPEQCQQSFTVLIQCGATLKVVFFLVIM